jgi:hypothetical protein
MKIKNIIASLSIISIMLAGTAFAAPNDSTKENQTLESLSPKQLEQWTELHDEHIQKTRPIRSELQAKRMELRALRNNTKVTPDYISELTEDIVKLQNRIEDMNKEFYEISEEKFDLVFSRMQGGNMNCPRSYGNCGYGGHGGMMRGHGNMGGHGMSGYHSQHGYGNDMNAKTPQQKQKM